MQEHSTVLFQKLEDLAVGGVRIGFTAETLIFLTLESLILAREIKYFIPKFIAVIDAILWKHAMFKDTYINFINGILSLWADYWLYWVSSMGELKR